MQTRPKLKKPITIGMVGGIASGKSHVARQLAALGAEVIDADQIGHEILEQPLIIRRLAQVYGTEIVVRDSIDRRALANLVFGDDEASVRRLEQLQEILHPMIHAEAIRQLRRFSEQADPPRAVVVDAPLLLEAKWDSLCDVILFIDTPQEIRVQRAKSRGWSEQHFEAREAKQMPLNAKRAAATHIIPSSDEAEVERALAQLWRQVVDAVPKA